MKKHFKKFSIKALATLLSVLMTFLSFPLSVFALDGNSNTPLTASTETEKDVFELINERTATTKRFRLSDGSYMVAQYDSDIHYMDENGDWQDIDNTLSVVGSNITTSDAKIKFAKKTTGNETLFALHDGNRKLTLSLNGAAKRVAGEITNHQNTFDEDATQLEKMTTLDKISASVLYRDILPDIDLEYVIKGSDVKENIIVKARNDAYSYTFSMSLNNLNAKLNEKKEIEIRDTKTGVLTYIIPAPVMWDANNALSNDISVSLTDLGNGNYTLMITPSAEWINNESRAFPVTVDPPIYPVSDSSVLDFYISPTETASSTVNSTYLHVGESYRSFWKLTSLPILPTSAYITNATFTPKGSLATDISGYIGVYEVLSAWDSTMTWQTSDILSENYTDYKEFAYASSPSLDFVVTPLVKKWYAGQNYGLALSLIQSTSFTGHINLYSSNYSTPALHPALCIEYVDMKGLEDYWSYTSQSAGFAGSGSINHATGNLVFAIPTLTTTDALMPFTPTLVYNSALADMRYAYPNAQTAYWIASAAAASMPCGFKLNIQETLICKSYIDHNYATKDLYIWADADGTEHCFRSTGINGIYRDEDGLLLDLTANASTVTIKDSGDNVRTFSKLSTQPSGTVSAWYLTSIADKVGNKIVFEVDSSYRPIAIKLDPIMANPIEQMRLWYNANGKLGAVYNPYSKEAVIFRYNGDYLSELLRVHTNSAEAINDSFWSSFYNTYPSSYDSGKYIVDAIAIYTFDDNGSFLSVENGLTSYRVTYEYDASLRKVIGVSESAAGDYYTQDDSTYYSAGQSIRLSYGAESTVIRTSGTDDILMTNDDLITTCVFDYAGRSISSYTTDLNQTVLYGASNGQYVGEENENAKNNLKSSVQTVQHSPNYLINGNFEMSGSSGIPYWTVAQGLASRILTIGYNERAGLRLTVDSSTTYSEVYQTVYLAQGKYTLGAKVKTETAQGVDVLLRVESDYQIFETEVPVNEKNASNGYVTVEVDIGADVSDYYKVSLIVSGSPASAEYVYFDQLMLSRTTGVSEYDMVRMGHFESTHGTSVPPLSQWTAWGSGTSVNLVDAIIEFDPNYDPFYSPYYETFHGNVLKLQGDFSGNCSVSQVVYEASATDRQAYDLERIGSEPRVFTVSGWGKGTAQSFSEYSRFALQVYVEYYYDGTLVYDTETFDFDFCKSVTDWQFLSGGFVSDSSKGLVNKITVKILYQNNPGIGYFDNITLIEDSETTNIYSYTDAGYLSSHQNGKDWTQSYYNSDNRVIRTVSSNKTMVEYEYNAYGLVLNEYHQKYSFFNKRTGVVSGATCLYYYYYMYSFQGQPQVTLLFAYETGDQSEACLYSETLYYDDEGSHIFGKVMSETDGLDNTTYYFYDENNGRAKAVTYPNGYGVYYEYDGMGNLQAVYPATLESGPMYDYYTGETEVNYAYDSVTKRLDTITTASTQYKFYYDEFGNNTEIEAGGRTLASYEYKKVLIDDGNITDYVPVNGKLDTLTYGNGLKVKYLYDCCDTIDR